MGSSQNTSNQKLIEMEFNVSLLLQSAQRQCSGFSFFLFLFFFFYTPPSTALEMNSREMFSLQFFFFLFFFPMSLSTVGLRRVLEKDTDTLANNASFLFTANELNLNTMRINHVH